MTTPDTCSTITIYFMHLIPRNSRFVLLLSAIFLASPSSVPGQVSASFELRYFSKDREANGITDFKGERAYFDTEQRIDFLETYARVAGEWFMDSALDKQAVEDHEVSRFLKNLKPRPLPETRKRILLDDMRKTGHQQGDLAATRRKVEAWQDRENLAVEEGSLIFLQPRTVTTVRIDTQRWRFYLDWDVYSDKGNAPLGIALKNGSALLAEAGLHANGNIFYTDNGNDRMGAAYETASWQRFRLEVDLLNRRYNLLVNGRKIGDWAELAGDGPVTALEIHGGTGTRLDNLNGLGFDSTGCDTRHPYRISEFLDETFQVPPSMQDWHQPWYDDSGWQTGRLPIVHGGEKERGEDLYLRRIITPGNFEQARLHIEALDPGGEIWINGQIVHVTHNRRPVELDITPFLVPYQENLVAIRVFAFRNEGELYHSPLDRNVGWFCGRAWIDLTAGTFIHNARAHTVSTEPGAVQHHRVVVQNQTDRTFSGKLRITYYPWFPREKYQPAASATLPLQIFARDSVHLHERIRMANPLLWTHEHPNLYRVEMKLLQDEQVVDDYVFTTGIRTISQKDGILRINGKPELLGGAQTMGFRMPVENIARWNRCAPPEILAEELLACKKMGNTLRIHVHAGGTYAHSINDPRIAGMADQMGVMLIWPTTSWIREGEWGGIDFGGYPAYMDQVFNHPSIVIWEGSNHPNEFGGKPLSYSNRFISKIYNTIYSGDSSRLISPSSSNRHFAYRNDAGTINREGDSIVPCTEWTAPMIVRGNQDAVTGYGAQWHNIRKWPDAYRQSLLNSRERAYINFEHEESIGMQNFEYARGKPWYRMPSYENRYDLHSIGRHFEYDEWRASQAWQAFSAYESMKWQRMKDIDGFSWCCLHGGPNSGTYRKPLIDALGHAKLAYHVNRMVLQDIMAGSDNPDVALGRRDKVTPMILNLGEARTVRLKVVVKDPGGKAVHTEEYEDVKLEGGRTVKKLPPFRHRLREEGYYLFEYYVLNR